MTEPEHDHDPDVDRCCETPGVTVAAGRPDPWADVVEEVVELPGGAVVVRHPRDGLELLDEEAFEREQFMPYWADLWPSAVALADVVPRRPPPRTRGAPPPATGCASWVAASRGPASSRPAAARTCCSPTGRPTRSPSPATTPSA